MNKIWNPRFSFIIFSLFFALFLFFFYVKYVPLIPSYQIVLVPVLFLGFFLTWRKMEYGILFFVFAFPLINSFPYFFGIYEHTPHAPAALVLFLFFLLGWGLHSFFNDFRFDLRHPVITPVGLFAGLICVSAVITAGRYMNFYPFLSDAVYEWNVNVTGVSSGGAVMSTLFHALNYLTGFAFLIILMSSIRSRDFIKKMIVVLTASFSVSLVLGYYQGFGNSGFGNTPFWSAMGQINATFKDPNAFATFLVVVFPLILSMIFVLRGWMKIFPGVVLGAGLFLYPHIGNRSSLLGLCLGVVVFLGLVVWKKKGFKPLVFGLIAAVLVIFIIGFFSFKESRLFLRVQIVQDVVRTRGSLVSISPERYFLWKEAARMASLYPLTGVGVGAFIIELPNYYSADEAAYANQLEQFRRNDSAENYFLHIAAELGGAGLILSLWIFGIILAGLIKVCRRFHPGDPDSYLMLGAVAAAAAYLPNIFFHSYIGSFEVKYIFWMTAAVVFWFGKKDGEYKKKQPSRNYLAMGTGLVVLLGGVHLWHSTHSLSLKSRAEKFDIQQDFGFYQQEGTPGGREFRWTQKAGGKTIEIEKPVLSIPLHAAHPDIQKNPIHVKLFLAEGFFREKKLLDKITIDTARWNTYEFYVPEEIGKEVILLIEVSRTWNPMKEKGIPDPRELGVAVGEIQFKNSK